MQFSKSSVVAFASILATAAADSVSITPHDSYSSSVGVLGCHIDINRVAYWPGAVDCNNMCVRLTHSSGRTQTVLKIDSSGGAHDISYDTWNYLSTGKSAQQDPTQGGGIPVDYKYVDMAECDDIIKTPGHKLPLSAANSMGFYAGCGPNSWVGKNSVLMNIATPTCTFGVDEVCTLNMAVSNQPSCPHQLGIQTPLNEAIENIQYGTGKLVKAVQ